MAYASTKKFYHGYPTPGPQSPSTSDVMNHIFFASEYKWKQCRETMAFDYVVIGSGFCSYAFVDRIIKNAIAKQPHLKAGERPVIPNILILERGPFFYPEHFQNLPVVFQNAVPDQNFMNETFPFTLSLTAATLDSSKGATPQDELNKNGATWQHGMVPFFGGRSTLWSAWCPRPSFEPEHFDLRTWPEELKNMMTPRFFEDAENLLGVTNADRMANRYAEEHLPEKFRIYNRMQLSLSEMLAAGVDRIPGCTGGFAAPLAVHDLNDYTNAFQKFSVVGPYLDLIFKYQLREDEENYTEKAKRGQVVVADNCVVERILHQQDASHQRQPTALETSRGILPIGKKTKIIMAVGCLPAATLLLNSYPLLAIPNVGKTFAAHFISAITVRIKKEKFHFVKDLIDFEMAALYLRGADPDSKLTFHADISVLHDTDPERYRAVALRYMPDVVATASMEQLQGSKDYIVFVYALLGEMDVGNHENHFHYHGPNEGGADKTANCLLNYSLNDKDWSCWNLMERAGFESLENVFADGKEMDYWNFNEKKWQKARYASRAPGLVHESSVMRCGPEPDGAVGFDFAPYGTKNVYVTGSSIWPAGGSWNPTMTMCGFAQKLADNLSHGGGI